MGRKPRNADAMPPPVPEASPQSDADRAIEVYRAKESHRRTNGPSNEEILKHIRATDMAAADDAATHAEYMAAVKAAEEAGVDKKALKDSRTMKKKDVADVISYYQKVLHYLALRDMPIRQSELFSPAESVSGVEQITPEVKEEAKDWEAEQEGYQAYHAERNADDHRYKPGSSQAQAWRRGWDRGDAEIQAEHSKRSRGHQHTVN